MIDALQSSIKINEWCSTGNLFSKILKDNRKLTTGMDDTNILNPLQKKPCVNVTHVRLQQLMYVERKNVIH